MVSAYIRNLTRYMPACLLASGGQGQADRGERMAEMVPKKPQGVIPQGERGCQIMQPKKTRLKSAECPCQ